MEDGLSSENMNATNVKATSISGTNTDFVDLEVGTVTATNVAVFTSFTNEFASAPKVLLTPATSGTHATEAYVAGASAGSFGFVGQSGLDYNYLARIA